ncbi:MAG: hypothetical protein E7480_05830 [Ruminococcaceae bacterium]|nr:hypothetical protein [Oscillospiraceae bacterium]
MKKIRFFVALILITSIISGCGRQAEQYEAVKKENFIYSEYTSVPKVEYQPTAEQAALLEGYKLFYDNGILALYCVQENGNIALIDKRSGELYFNTSVSADSDSIATQETKMFLKSALIINYFDKQTEKTATSYELSVQKDGVKTEAVDGGVKVIYTFGDGVRDITDIPQKLSEKRFEELFVNHPALLENDKKRAKIYYKYSETEKAYVLSDTKNTTINLLSQILERISYTDEDLKKDNEENGLKTVASQRLYFEIPVYYTLENESMRVNIPMDEVKYTESKPLLRITLNKYFGATSQTEGAMLVPYESGGLLFFSASANDTGEYSTSLYGSNDTDAGKVSNKADNNNSLALFGMYKKDSGFIGIIENGDALCTVSAEKANTKSSLNSVWADFQVRNYITAVLGDGGLQSDVKVVQKEMYKGDICVKYSFVSKEDISYGDLASYYRGYAAKKYSLTQKKNDSVPLTVTAVGSIREDKSLFGFKYNGVTALTSYSGAKSMLEYLNSQSINNIKMILSGALKGGLENESISKLKLENKLGKSSVLSDIANSSGVELLISIDALSVPKDASGFNRYNDTAQTIDKSIAKKYSYDIVTMKNDGYRYLISPLKYSSFTNDLVKFLGKSYFEGISFTDLGTKLYSHNADDVVITRQDAKNISLAQLEKYSQSGELVLSNPYEAALQYADAVINLTSSINKNIDEQIPFYQMVYHSLVDYSGTPINEASDIQEAVLRCLERGENPYFRVFSSEFNSAANTDFSYLYCNGFEVLKQEIADIYKTIDSVLSEVSGMYITGHEKIKDGFYKTIYGDKIAIYVNYNDNDEQYNEITVKANSYEKEVLSVEEK